jgi:hypothetical protein
MQWAGASMSSSVARMASGMYIMGSAVCGAKKLVYWLGQDFMLNLQPELWVILLETF